MEPDHPEPELLSHLVVEFRQHGRRAVEFLATARFQIEAGVHRSPRTPETVAYCLREALKTITASQARREGGEWQKLSRRVVDAKQRYSIAAESNLPGTDADAALAELLAAIADMEEFLRSEGVHQRRLIAVIVDRTGAFPYESGTEMVRAYQKLLKDLDNGLHDRVDGVASIDLYNRSTGLLRRLFLPPQDRNAELEALAAVPHPSLDDLSRLRQLVVSPQHLERFLRKFTTTAWLNLLSDSTFLDPPTGEGSWPGFAAAEALIPTDPVGVVDWLSTMYQRCRSNATQAWYIFRAGADAGELAHPLLLRILREHAASPPVRDIAGWFLDSCEPADQIVADMADILLNSTKDEPWVLGRIATLLVNGINDTNAIDRLNLVAYKIRAVDQNEHGWRWFSMDPSGTIASRDLRRREDRFDVLLGAFVAAAQTVQELHGTGPVLSVADTLPNEIRWRMRAWLLGTDTHTPPAALAAEIETAISGRDPTGDDLRVVDRVVAELPPDTYQPAWTAALGAAPTIERAGRAIGEHKPDPAWVRAYQWLGILPEAVQGPWADVYTLMCAAYGTPRRTRLEHRPDVDGGWGQSPFTAEELGALEPIDAAKRVGTWRPDPSQFLVGPRELSRALQAAVEADPARWLARPYQVAVLLHEPIHISHYLQGAAKGIGTARDVPVDELMKVIELVWSHPWEPEAMGRSDWDYDPDWRQAEEASIAVLRALADHNVGFADHEDRAWEIIKAAVLNRTEPSGLPDESDPLTSAINRLCTRALEAAVSFMNWEHQTHGAPRTAAFELLEEALHLDGFEGAQHRAIIASRFGFFVAITPDWLETNAELLFGSDASDGLGQVTVDLTLRWSLTSPWLMERFRGAVHDAVARDVDHALDHLFIAHVWQIPGYSTPESVTFLISVPGLPSRAGEALGRLARNADQIGLAAAVELWRAVLDAGSGQDLAGFGWFAEVVNLDDTEWAELTLRTMASSGGTIEWANGVSERTAKLAPTTTTLAIFDDLVRHAGRDWDRRHAGELAVAHLASAEGLARTPEFQRLHTTLSERGLA